MKKYWEILIAPIFIFCISCSSENKKSERTDWVRASLNGKVQTVSTRIFEKSGTDSANIELNEYTNSQVLSFNENGYLTEVITKSASEGQSKRIFKYNADGKREKVEILTADRVQGTFIYNYSEGNLIEIIAQGPNGETIENAKYEYTDGRKSSVTAYGRNKTAYLTKKFDKKGNVIEVKEGYTHIKFKYDGNDIIEKSYLDENGILKSKETYSKNEKVKSLYNEDWDPGSIRFNIYTELENKCQCSGAKETHEEDGSMLEYSKNCDNKGNWTRAFVVKKSGNSNMTLLVREILYF